MLDEPMSCLRSEWLENLDAVFQLIGPLAMQTSHFRRELPQAIFAVVCLAVQTKLNSDLHCCMLSIAKLTDERNCYTRYTYTCNTCILASTT